MPPPYPDLTFDQQAADEAISALQSAYTMLSEQLGTRQGLAARALQNWQGSYADQFTSGLQDMMAGGQALLGEIQSAIQAISRACTEAAQQAQANAAWQREQQELAAQAAARERAAQAAAAAAAQKAAAEKAAAAQAAAQKAAAAKHAGQPPAPSPSPSPPPPHSHGGLRGS